MVGIYLLVVPGFGAAVEVRCLAGCRQFAGDIANGLHHTLTLVKMTFRQITAVRTGIGNQLVAFVQVLGGVQYVFRAHAEQSPRLDLQGRK